MAVDDFLMVVPEDWTEIANASHIVGVNGGAESVQGIIASGVFTPFNEYDGIKETAYLPDGYVVTDARMFNTGEIESPIRLWIKIAPGT